MQPGTVTAVTRTTMTIEWAEPLSTGGCPILSYSVFTKAATDLEFVEVDPELVNNVIELRSYTVTFSDNDTGSLFDFFLAASNEIGTAESEVFSYTLAAVPNQPLGVP